MSSTLVLNLIGNFKNVSKASYEVREFIYNNNFNKYLGYKVIKNNLLDNHLNRFTIPHDIVINECNFLSEYELENIHNKIENNVLCSKKLHSIALLISSNKDKKKFTNLIENSKYIHYIYPLHYSEKYKYNLLKNIIFKSKNII